MNLDMDFPNIPCFLLKFEHSTEVNILRAEEIHKQLEFRHVDENGKQIEQSDKS